jgi:hypothetical protein
VQNIFPCLYDSDEPARAQALQVVCRVSHRNPAYALPTLRNMLNQLLTDMKFGNLRDQQCSAEVRVRWCFLTGQLLGAMIVQDSRVVRPYVDGIVLTLTPKVIDWCESVLMLPDHKRMQWRSHSRSSGAGGSLQGMAGIFTLIKGSY